MHIIEKHFRVTFNQSRTEYLFKFPAPLEGLVSRFIVKREDASGFTVFLLSNTFRLPDNDDGTTPSSDLITTHDENLLRILSLNTSGNTASYDGEFGKPYRNLHMFRHKPNPNLGTYHNVSGDNYLFILFKVPASAQASFLVSITIITELTPT